MKIPSRMELFAHDIDVSCVPTIEGDKYLGMAYVSENRMEIAETYNGNPISESQKAETFFHECTHTVDCKLGIGLSERQVKALSVGMFYLILKNNLDFLDRSV